jgi:hypothetical protein
VKVAQRHSSGTMANLRFGTCTLRRPRRAIDPCRPRLAYDRVDVGSLVLGSPIAHCDQPPDLCRRQRGGDLRKRAGNHPAHGRIWIVQEQNRGATRYGDASKRQAHGQGAAGCLLLFFEDPFSVVDSNDNRSTLIKARVIGRRKIEDSGIGVQLVGRFDRIA